MTRRQEAMDLDMQEFCGNLLSYCGTHSMMFRFLGTCFLYSRIFYFETVFNKHVYEAEPRVEKD